MPTPLLTLLLTTAAILVLALLIHLCRHLGGLGAALRAQMEKAPGLDALVFLFTIAPPIATALLAAYVLDEPGAGWGVYLLIGVAAQCLALIVWSQAHELVRGRPPREDRIHPTMDKIRGPVANHFAVWWTALAVPLFWLVRMGEWIIYTPLTWSVKLPKYKSHEWVNVSRHKFDGLTGYDLIWCLYCDWMTGVWSLGSEMLRNVESFWCPIRYGSRAKCENCKIDFPDIDLGWVPADAKMSDVTRLLREKYPGPKGDSPWFGHPSRAELTVGGEPVKAKTGGPDA